MQQLVRDTIVQIGYDNSKFGFDGRTAGVLVALDEQSRDIAQGVDDGLGAARAQRRQPTTTTSTAPATRA